MRGSLLVGPNGQLCVLVRHRNRTGAIREKADRTETKGANMACIKRTKYGYRADWRDKKGDRYRKTFELKQDARASWLA